MADSDTQDYSLAEVLRTMASGRFHDEATAALQSVVAEMWRQAEAGGGKPKGKVTVTLSMVLDRGVLEIDPGVNVKMPPAVRARTMMYPSSDGRLSRTQIRQREMELDDHADVATRGVVDIQSARANDR